MLKANKLSTSSEARRPAPGSNEACTESRPTCSSQHATRPCILDAAGKWRPKSGGRLGDSQLMTMLQLSTSSSATCKNQMEEASCIATAPFKQAALNVAIAAIQARCRRRRRTNGGSRPAATGASRQRLSHSIDCFSHRIFKTTVPGDRPKSLVGRRVRC
eukprot:scaffold28288_cov127-Isochrysis_galbana.AAC.4